MLARKPRSGGVFFAIAPSLARAQNAAMTEPTNQPPAFAPRDLWTDDAALREAVAREGAGAFEARIATYGCLAGDALYALSFDTHRDKPRLRTHDRFGARIDRVEFHPNYHALMQAAIEHGVAGLSWHAPAPGAHVARAALSYLHHQVEPGTSCPLTMTHAAVPALRREPALSEWAAKATAPHYDPREVPIADKLGVTLGMGMTEKQGGSDVRANTTRAQALDEAGTYALTGHKWFFSAPMSDGFLVLAQAPGGLTCFLLPRRLPDGARNAFTLMRLKDKLGDWANASSEVEFQGAWARRIGDEGRGIATILDMVMLTRLDCMLGSAAEMRMALAHAMHHARHRSAFGKVLVDQPLMRNVLADLALESEAALALSIRVARAVDAAERDANEADFARIATAIGKYWICKRAPAFVNEAQECLGGAGYVEESLLPRLYRQAPLNSIWEGSGNIQCLDVLRALQREPASGGAFFAELDAARGMHAALDAEVARLRDATRAPQEADARALVERMALALQASVLLRAQVACADLFCRSRLGDARGQVFGTLPASEDFGPMLLRVLP
jgi:putative acyl-CoA dehydrogenase